MQFLLFGHNISLSFMMSNKVQLYLLTLIYAYLFISLFSQIHAKNIDKFTLGQSAFVSLVIHLTSNISQGDNTIEVRIVPIINNWQSKLNDKHFRTRDLLFSSNSKLLDQLSLSRRDSESAFGEVSASPLPFLFVFLYNIPFETGVQISSCACESSTF